MPTTHLLWPDRPPLWPAERATPLPSLELLPHPDGGCRACLMILPGGGYQGLAGHEGAPVARIAHAAGMHAAICHYRVRDHERLEPLTTGPLHDAQRAIRRLRQAGVDWGMDGRVVTLGFSAGGHLATSCGVHHRLPPPPEDDLGSVSARPDRMVACYAVLRARGPAVHAGSIANLCGPTPNEVELDFHDLPPRLDASAPPVFAWHTADDAPVPLANCLDLAAACAAHAVPVEVHVYAVGRHGLGLAEDDPVAGAWPGLCAAWLTRLLAAAPV